MHHLMQMSSGLKWGEIYTGLSDVTRMLSLEADMFQHKIGMHSAVMEPDAAGTFVGSSYCYATPRDWAKFGQLYLNDGLWEGERILPAGWVEYTYTPAKASENGYGAFFWLNQDGEMADVPKNTYSCQGFQGQRVFILPSQNLVVVRMGLSDVDVFDFNKFLNPKKYPR